MFHRNVVFLSLPSGDYDLHKELLLCQLLHVLMCANLGEFSSNLPQRILGKPDICISKNINPHNLGKKSSLFSV